MTHLYDLYLFITITPMKSNCCNAEMTVGGEGATRFWVCESCKKACDPATDLIPENTSKLE